jgi:hypothetical protein
MSEGGGFADSLDGGRQIFRPRATAQSDAASKAFDFSSPEALLCDMGYDDLWSARG